MEAAKHIISEALSVFTQFGFFILSVFAGLKIQGHELALVLGLAVAALIIAYNDYKEKKHREQSTDDASSGTYGSAEGESESHADAISKTVDF
ncbi:hypothetical protein [Oceanospirillum maris]|uniref:hypothetical protein n=1 Tax=Oceanospirillum maris TaxID=64977 RepID=UPI000414F05B|nr:hypothetical protein [Oceanospirillum maris]